MVHIKIPEFYLIGLPKAGTTSIYETLIQSPQVFNCSVKEPNFFLPENVSPVGVRDMLAYESLFEMAQEQGQYKIDASVSYSHYPEALRKILALRENAKFLLVLRCPEALAISQFQQMKYSEFETFDTFSDAWYDRIVSGAPKYGFYTFARDYPRSSAVGDIVERVKSIVPKEQLHIMILEEFKATPDKELRGVIDFLGINDFDFVSVHSNSAKVPKFRGLHQQILHQGALFRACRTIFRAVPFIDTRLLSRLYFEKMVKKPSEPVISESMRAELESYFAPQKNKVELLLGRRILAWR